MSRIGGLAVVFLLAACGGAFDSQAREATVRDSSGVRIVENGRPAEPLGSWTVASEPSVVVGDLVRVVGARLLSDGRMVIAQGEAPLLRWYGQDGEFEIGTGRMGLGLGDFERGIDAVWLLEGDSVSTWEQTLARIQLFSPDGVYARSVALEPPPDYTPRNIPRIVGGSEAGFVTQVLPQREVDAVGSLARPDDTYDVHRPDGTFSHRLGDFPGYQSLVVELEVADGSQTLRAQGRPPFALSGFGLVRGDRFYFGPTHRYEISVRSLDGELRTLIRKTVRERPVTAELRSAWIAEYRSRQDRSSPRVRPAPEDMPFPAEVPAHGQLLLDREGSLWVQDHPLPGERLVRWSVFDPDGGWTTEVELPSEWEIQEIGADYVLVLVEDAPEEARVMRFALTR